MKWDTIPFGDLYAIPSKNGLNRPTRVRGSGYKMVNMGELFKYDRIFDPPMDRVQANDSEKEKYSLKRGDLLFARQSLVLSGTGKCSIILQTPELTTFESHLIRVRLNGKVANPFFYYYYFQSPAGKANVLSISMQVAAAGIRGSDLALLKVPKPPLPIQDQIATILSAYDDLIENNTRRIRILEEMSQAIYREWFVNFHFPGHENVRMVESELGLIPEGWEVTPFTVLAEVLSGGTPKTTEPYYWGGDIPWFTPQDINNSIYILDTKRNITSLGLSKCNSRLYPEHTVFITARGTVGKVVLASQPMAMSQTSYALIGREGLSQLFLYHLTKFSVNILKQRAIGAVFDTIIVDTFNKLLVIRPSEDLILKFHSITSPTFSLIRNLLSENNNLSHQRDILSPCLINGYI